MQTISDFINENNGQFVSVLGNSTPQCFDLVLTSDMQSVNIKVCQKELKDFKKEINSAILQNQEEIIMGKIIQTMGKNILLKLEKKLDKQNSKGDFMVRVDRPLIIGLIAILQSLNYVSNAIKNLQKKFQTQVILIKKLLKIGSGYVRVAICGKMVVNLI